MNGKQKVLDILFTHLHDVENLIDLYISHQQMITVLNEYFKTSKVSCFS